MGAKPRTRPQAAALDRAQPVQAVWPTPEQMGDHHRLYVENFALRVTHRWFVLASAESSDGDGDPTSGQE
jgi:hypothetical protein